MKLKHQRAAELLKVKVLHRGILLARMMAIFLLDLACSVSLNLLYVNIYVQLASSAALRHFIVLLFALLKVSFNDTVVPAILSDGFLRLGMSLQDVGRFKAYLFGNAALLEALFLVINNVVVPLIATASLDPNCFQHVWRGDSRQLTTQASFDQCYAWAGDLPVVVDVSGSGGFNASLSSNSASLAACSLNATVIETSVFTPPFLYSYQCSSALVTNYAPVYILMFLYLAICDLVADMGWRIYFAYLDPVAGWAGRKEGGKRGFFHWLRRQWLRATSKPSRSPSPAPSASASQERGDAEAEGKEEEAEGKEEAEAWARFLVFTFGMPVLTLLPHERRAVMPAIVSAVSKGKSLALNVSPEGNSTSPASASAPLSGSAAVPAAPAPKYFVLGEAEFFFAELINALVLLVTFGAVCPLLGAVIVAAIAVKTTRRHALVGCLIMETYASLSSPASASASASGSGGEGPVDADPSTAAGMLRLLEQDCQTIPPDVLKASLWFLLQLMAAFFTCFIVDIAGDDKESLSGPQVIAAVVCMLLSPLCLRGLRHLNAVMRSQPVALQWCSRVCKFLTPMSEDDLQEDEEGSLPRQGQGQGQGKSKSAAIELTKATNPMNDSKRLQV